jgi:hypothetical protein
MKELAEFTELSKRMAENEMTSYTFYNQFREKYPDYSVMQRMSKRDPAIDKEMSRAFKKDGIISKQLTSRYYYLLENKVQGFWD